MKSVLATARFLLTLATWTTLPLAAPLHGAEAGFPFAEDFQLPSLLNSTDTTARWTSSGVTLGRARGVHETVFSMQDRLVGAAGTAEIFDIALQDINGDSRPDIVTAGPNGVVVYFNNPVSGFSPASSTVVTATSFHLLTFGDYDRDGDLDIVSGSWLRRSNVVLHKNDGRGGFDSAVVDSSVPDLVANGLATADIDGDGHLDLAVALQGRAGGVDLYRNDGNAGFRHQDTVDSGGPHRDIQMGDVNGDGRPDIVLVKDGVGGFHLNSFNPASPDVWRFEGMRSFSSRTGTRLVLGDVNNDSHLDIVVSVRSARNRVHLNDGSGVFGSAFIGPNRTSMDVALGDIDGDGDLDVVAGNIRHRRGFSFIYTNDGSGNFDTNGSRILLARSRGVALGDVDNDGDLDIVFGNQNETLRVKENPGTAAADAPSDNLFDTGRGRVVSGKVNGEAPVPHVVFLTATAVQQAHTEIEYYLSNDGGGHWVRGYPGESVRFLARGNDLRWRAELKSHSSTLTPTLMRVGIENVLQVTIDGDVFRGNEIYTATSQTTREASTPVTVRLLNRGDRALTITGIETVGKLFMLQDSGGEPLPQSLSIEIEGKSHADFRLVFEPERRGTTDSVLTIFGRDERRTLPEVKVGLRGRGLAPEIGIPDIGFDPIGVRVGTSGSQTVEIKNNGEESLSVRTPTIASPEFSLVNPSAFPVPVTAGESVEIGFWFEPENRGTTTTDIIFPSNAFNGAVTRTLTGQGLAPIIEIPPPALVSVREGRRTTSELVIRNTGDWDMDITGVTGTDEFFDLVSPTTASINGIGMTVEKESSETVVFSFRPKRNMRSSPTANIIFTSNAFNDTQTEVILKGIGTAPEIDFKPTVNFGGVRVGASGTQTMVIENMGDAPLIVSGVISKTTAADVRGLFAWVPPFPGAASQTVAAEATATLTLRFTPRIRRDAPFTDTLMIDSDAVNMTDKFLTVSGNGIAPVMAIVITGTGLIKPRGSTAAVSRHDFGDVPIKASTSREVYISNDGTAPLEVAVSLVGGRGFRWDSTPDGVITVEDGFSAADLEPAPNLVVHFRPQDREPDTARLIFRDTRNNLHTTYTLTGQGLEAEMQLRMGDDILDENTTHTISAIRAKTTTTVHVEVHNIGNASMDVRGSVRPDRGDIGGFALIEGDDVLKAVTGGHSVTFGFRFTPRERGTAITPVTFDSGVASRGKQTIVLKGRSVGPEISTVPNVSTGVRFGNVRVGTTTDREVVITNRGDLPLVVTSAMVLPEREGERALSLVGAQFPQTVGIGTSRSLTLRFTPKAPGEMTGTLVIASDTVKTRDQSLELDISGEAIAPEMVIRINGRTIGESGEMLYDFGDIRVDASSEAKVVIDNSGGSASLEVQSPRLNSPALVANPHFDMDERVNFPLVVEAGGISRSSLTLLFDPQERGPQTTTLTLVSDALNGARRIVTLKGRGLSSEMELRVGGQRLAPNMEHPTGDTGVDKNSVVDVVVHNLGNLPMMVSTPVVTDVGEIEGFVPVDAGSLPATVGGGSSRTFTFRFSPREHGDAATRVTFVSDANDNASQTITLTGRGTGAEMQLRVGGEILAPNTTHTVSDIPVGKSTDVRVEVHNIGNVSMEVERPRKAGMTEEGFTLLENGGLPDVVTEGQSVVFTYRFKPNKRGTATTLVTFSSSAMGSGNVVSSSNQTIILHSKGVGPVISLMPDVNPGTPGVEPGVRFEEVHIGGSSDQKVVITNTGELPLMITSVEVINTGFARWVESELTVVNPPEFPVGVLVDETLLLTLRFMPKERKWIRGLLLVESDTVGGTGSLSFTGQGVGAEISIAVTATGVAVDHALIDQFNLETLSYDFGSVPVGTSASAKVSIANPLGDLPLRVEIDEIENNPDFRWENYPAGGVVDLDARESASDLILTFEPKSHGVKTAGFVMSSNAYNVSRTIVTLTGRGRGKPRMEVEIGGSVRRHEGAPYVFAPQRVGTTESVKVTIRNMGNDDLMITSIETTPTSFRFIERPPPGISVLHPSLRERHRLGYTTTGDIEQPVAAGSSATFMLHFSPSLPSSEDNALLTIRSDDPDHPDWSLNLEGRGMSRMLRVRLFIGDDIHDDFADAKAYDVGDRVVSQTFFPSNKHMPYQVRASAGFKLPESSARIRLHNMGDIPVTTDNIGIDDGGADFFRVERGHKFERENGTWFQYNAVFFEPTLPGVYTATVVISSDDDVFPEVRIRLKGKGIAPGIDARVSDFGDVPVGGSSVTEVAVLNDGDAPLTINGVAAVGNSSFEADVVPSELPVVQPGHASTFHVSFAPLELGVTTAALILTSDALGESEHRVVLRGNGLRPENTLDIEVGGQAMTSQAPFGFGRVRMGKTTAVAVTVSNRGASGLRLKPRVEGRSYSLADDETKTVLQTAPGVWILRFHPESRGAHQSTLTIVDVDNPLNSRAWRLAGFGHGPQIKVEVGGSAHNSGADYNFGTISYGSATTAVVQITNKGNSALNIKSVKVTPEKLEYSAYSRYGTGRGPGFAHGVVDTGYSLVNSNIRIIPSSDSASFELHFTPVIPIANDSVLTIVSDDPEHPEWNLNLTGRGTGPFLAFFNSGRTYANNHLLTIGAHIGTEVSLYTYLRDYANLGDSVLNEITGFSVEGEGFRKEGNYRWRHLSPGFSSVYHTWPEVIFAPTRLGPHTGTYTIHSNDRINPAFTIRLQGYGLAPGIAVAAGGSSMDSLGEYDFGDIPVDGSSQTRVEISNGGNGPILSITDISVNGNEQFSARITPYPLYPVLVSSGTDSWSFDLSFAPTEASSASARLIISSNAHEEETFVIRLRGNGVAATSASSNWADSVQRPAIPIFTEIESADIGAPRFVGLGYADEQSRLWLAFDEPAQILSGADARVLADGAALSGFEVLPNYTGGDGVEDIGVLRAGYRSGGVVMDLARGIGSADASVWVRYTPPFDGVSGIYDLASPPNRIASVRLFMLPRSAVLDYDGDGFPDALEARLGGNPLVADDVVGLPEVALLRAGAAGSPAAVAYSGIRADGVAAHLGVVTTGASSLAAYYLSDTFGYSGGYAPSVGGYGCTGRFPADYASPLFGGGCAVVDFNNIRAGVEHRIGWLAMNAAGYWAVAEGTASRLPEMVILRVPEFNMKRRNVFVANSAAADEAVVVGAFHDGPASSQSLIVSLSNVAAADSPSSREPDGFSVSVAGGAPNTAPGATPGGETDAAKGATTSTTLNITNYAITGVHSGEDSKLWLAGDPLSSLTPDKYSLGKVTQTDVVRLADDNLPPLFGRTSLYVGSTADENERHAVVVRGTENYIALLPVVQGSAQTASAFEVSPWDGAGGGPVAADDRIVAVNEASPVADGALVRIAFTASSPPATVRNTMSLEVAASSAGADTATTVLTWPVIDSADALATITGDNDNDGIPDVRDSYRLLNRLPIAVVGGVSGYPDRSSAGADGWHHIRPLLPLHNQFVGSYATRAGLSFHTGFNGDARILARLPVRTSGGEAITAPEGQSVLAATYQPGVAIQMNYADFAASLSRDEFVSMAQQSRQDIAVVYNFRLHGVEPSVAQDAALVGGRAGVVIPLPESLRETASILPLHYTNGAWSGFSTEPDAPTTAGFAPLQAGACPDDNGLANSPYRTENSALNARKRTGDACMVLYLTDGAAADRDGNLNGVVDALIGLAAIPSKE